MLGHLRRQRGAALTFVAVLGLTTAVTTAAVDVIAAYLWRPWPYPEPDRLAVVDFPRERGPGPLELQRTDWSGLRDSAELVIASDVDVFTVLGAETPFSANGRWMSADAFAAFGVAPLAGRLFTADEARRGEPVAVIGEQLWQDRFASDPGAIGRSINVRATLRRGEALTVTIVGVIPARFWHLDERTSLILPLRTGGTPSALRLRAGIAPIEAAARVTAIVRASTPGVGADWTAVVRPIREAHVERIRPMLTATAWGVLLLASVALANLAFLQMARGVARQREMAVRSVLGASGRALAREVLSEGVQMGAIAGGAGLALASLLAQSSVGAIERFFGRIIPGGAGHLGADPMLGAAAIAACLVAGTLLALVMLAASKSAALPAALGGHPSATDTPGRQAARQAIVGTQVAVAFCLLVTSVLMIRTAWHLGQIDLGFEPRGVLSANVTLHERAYPSLDRRRQFFADLLNRLSQLPDVTAVGLTDWLPFRVGPIFGIEPEGEARVRSIGASIQSVTPGYFTALQMTLVEGRLLTADDRAGRAPVAVISRALARALWADGSAAGRTFRLRFSNANPGRPGFGPFTIVGVVNDSLRSLIDATPPQVYLPFDQQPLASNAFLHVRTTKPPMTLAPAVARLVSTADPEVPVASVAALNTIVEEEGLRPRFLAMVLAGFALLSLGIAVIGLHAVSAWIAGRRQREAALRVALGADRRSVALLLARRGLIAVGCGLVGGWIASAPLAAMLASEVHGLARSDVLTRTMAAAAVVGAAAAALLVPAWRAATLNLSALLRAE